MARGKGMVQFGGATYRIVKLSRGKYDVFRLLDDVRVGGFESGARLRVEPVAIDEKVLFEIAVAALRQAKISWQSAPAPVPEAAPANRGRFPTR
jgi:hypothetical protein